MKKLLLASLFFIVSYIVASSSSYAQTEQTDIDDEHPVSGWLRVEMDPEGPQLWVGSSYYLADFVDLAANARLVSSTAEFDLGLAFYVGPVSLTPMLGIVFDFDPEELRPAALSVPQLFTVIDGKVVYFESWIQLFFQDLFADEQEPQRDYFYSRNFLLIVLGSQFAIGPQIEIDVSFNNAGEEPLVSLPLGGRINLGLGETSILGLFLGYEFEKHEDALGLTGRFSFITSW